MKSKFITAALAALTLSALGAGAADAAPMHQAKNVQIARYDARDRDEDRGRGHIDQFHDRNHRPPMKVEYRPHQPRGHYGWHAGRWNWRGGRWVWAPGIWVRF